MSHWACNLLTGKIHSWNCYILNRCKIKNIIGLDYIIEEDNRCKICNPDPNEYQSQIKSIDKEDKKYRTFLEHRKQRKHTIEVIREKDRFRGNI